MYSLFCRSNLRFSVVFGLVLAGFLVSFFSISPAYAGGVVGDGTAASCTEAAFNTRLVGGGNVTFNCGGAKTITLTTRKQISVNTSIDGGGLITISGGNNSDLFQVFVDRIFLLQNITLANGLSTSGNAGALENFGITSIINSQLTNNRSTSTGGAIYNTGTGILTVTNSTLSNNQALNDGGGIHSETGSLTISNSQFISNQVTGFTSKGGAIFVNTGASAVISTTLISGNISAGSGGGIYDKGNLALTNVTLSGNRANASGGGGIYQDAGTATLTFVTVASNTGFAFGGGVYNDGLGSGTMNLRNTMLANNSGGDCDGVVGSLGYNLSSDNNCASFTQTGDQKNIPLPLGPLTQNGGPTLTHRPIGNNPAINGGDCIGGVSTDQRSFARPSSLSPLCDVGALEVGPSVFLPAVLK